MLEGPLGGPRPFVSGVRRLQVNFRFSTEVINDESLFREVVVRNSPETGFSIDRVLVGPDARNEVVSVTGTNQITLSELNVWETEVNADIKDRTDRSVIVEEVVVIGEFE